MIKTVFFIAVAYGLFCWFDPPNALSNNILPKGLVLECGQE